uniref:RIKEN cDNA 4930556J24 gene n=1 Tax=Mus spicilegus TaxID=10103 RepID=A0A8C6GAD5_MUSSI
MLHGAPLGSGRTSGLQRVSCAFPVPPALSSDLPPVLSPPAEKGPSFTQPGQPFPPEDRDWSFLLDPTVSRDEGSHSREKKWQPSVYSAVSSSSQPKTAERCSSWRHRVSRVLACSLSLAISGFPMLCSLCLEHFLARDMVEASKKC